MKSVALLALAAGAMAQIPSYNSVGLAIDAKVTALNSAVLAYTGGNGAAAISDANALLSAINSGAAEIKKLSSITDYGSALGLLTVYQTTLAADVKTVISNLIAKRSAVDANGLCSTVSVLLHEESSAAIALADAVTDQLQNSLVAGATDIASMNVINPITSALNSGIAAYTSCPSVTSKTTTSSPPTTTTTSTGPGTTTTTTTTSGSTCTSTGYNTKQIKKCLKIISSAALAGNGGYGYGEL